MHTGSSWLETNYLILLQNRGWLGGMWQRSTRKWYLIRLPGLMYLSDKPIKVHEAWDGNHGQFSSPTSPFSAKPVLILDQNGLALLPFWPETHVCMVVDWYYTSLNSILVYYKGS